MIFISVIIDLRIVKFMILTIRRCSFVIPSRCNTNKCTNVCATGRVRIHMGRRSMDSTRGELWAFLLRVDERSLNAFCKCFHFSVLPIQVPHYGTKPGRFETSNRPLSHKLGSEWAVQANESNGRASGPVLTSGLLAVLNHCVSLVWRFK